MNRRNAIKGLVVASSAILIFPSCFTQEGKSSISLNNLDINSEQERVLNAIVETLIPAGDTPGGKELQLHLFVMKMIDDCHDEEDQQNFMLGFSQFKDAAYQQLGESFEAASKNKKKTFLEFLENNQGLPKGLSSFYRMTKQRTIQGYLNSKFVMTNLIKYELVPGRYDGYMPVSV